MSPIPLFQVDSFTDHPFAGNPAGVCLLDAPQPAEWMQFIAKEMNLSETAFLVPQNDGYHLRWFTPVAEVELCGHATLASAHILWETGRLRPEEEARFDTLSGRLTCQLDEGWIRMDFPATPVKDATAPLGMGNILKAHPRFIGRSIYDMFVELGSEDEVRNLKPDLAAIRRFPTRGLIVTAQAKTQPYDFVSRFFAPQVGVDEDPVTGSAHSALTPYWSAKLGKTEMLAFQASARGGVVRVKNMDERVAISGQAVTIFNAELSV